MMTTALLAYYLAFFAIALAWPTWRLWKREKINGLVLANDDSAYGLIGRWFQALIGSVFLLLLALAVGLDFQVLGPLAWAEQEFLSLAGVVILLVSITVIYVAQMHMGRSWRIGIDQNTQTDLVTHGLFAKSRNPIFLGMRLNMLGLFLVLPCAVTLSIMLLSEALISVQVRLEEAHLMKMIGEAYRSYHRKTPRWF
jgi:protein-S-isoprenylcysteine O-methyltransferase Ste14